MNTDKLYKLSSKTIRSKFLRHYMPDGKFSVDEALLQKKVKEIEKKISELIEERDAPLITRLKKESIVSSINTLKKEKDEILNEIAVIENNRIIIEEIYREKVNEEKENNVETKSTKNVVFGVRRGIYGEGTHTFNEAVNDSQFFEAQFRAIILMAEQHQDITSYDETSLTRAFQNCDEVTSDSEFEKEYGHDLRNRVISARAWISGQLLKKKKNESKEEEEKDKDSSNDKDNNTDQLNKEATEVQEDLSGYKISKDDDGNEYVEGSDGKKYKYDATTGTYIDDTTGKSIKVDKDGDNKVVSVEKTETKSVEEAPNAVDQFNNFKANNKVAMTNQAPFDVRLRRSDLFVNGSERIPFSSDEASPVISELIDYAVSTNSKHTGHVVPASRSQYQSLINNSDLFGTLSLVNPYTVTRLYHGLDNIKISGKVVQARTNRMLDIRDQKRFYDIKSTKEGDDYLNVSNPTVNNIITLMNNDRWGRTPYSYQDFVFCKYFGRIPNNRMITLRKYASPTYDNLCWELMGADNTGEMKHKFAPIATCVTYFGGDSGNSLSDIFKIKTGLNWGKTKAEIWNVTGDAGETTGSGMMRRVEDIMKTNNNMSGTLGILSDVFPNIGSIGSKALSLAKFFGMAKSPNAFDGNPALASKMYEALHDPNTNGPYANRIQGPLNRIDEVYKRDVGIKFENEITLKFAYKAHPIGGINTKAVMLDIISNMLTMCSATAVFWGGGHRFMIAPREYPWSSVVSPGIMKDVYNGKFFGQDGAIAKTLRGFMDAGSVDGQGGWSWDTALNALGNLGMGVLGVLGGAVNTLLGSLSGQLVDQMQNAANSLLEGTANKFNGKNAYNTGKVMFTNLMQNAQNVWRSNSIKESVLPSVEGMRSILIGTPVGNWHLTVGNPLNPIAVIGNLICEDVTFNFGEEIGPDDFPMEMEATVTLHHGMARDLDGIESMFNRGAGRIYQAPDYARMFGGQVSSDAETRVDAMTGGTSARVPAAFTMVEDANALKNAGKKGTTDMTEQNVQGTVPSNSGHSDTNIVCPMNNIDVSDWDYGHTYDTPKYSRTASNIRAVYAGNWATRKYTDS